MILLFEPKNPEALKFQPLLQRKLKLDERAALAGDDDDEDDDESSSDDSDEGSFDDSDDMTSSDESTDLEEKGDKEKELNTISEQSKVAQNPARTILQMIFGGDFPEFINPHTKIDLAEEIKKLDDF
ncbi:glutamate-rich protein 2 [Biomphalaria pfeifferi]|uniref:Glutamate-rich protein 2 n=1 Tax=Biomphalaria pfeifferi TaxID=112525 RepID=A0AAD8AXG1_BIOPF|nr:glutamate-rich protein 2 [Biomphalaria pfeifferi]